MDLSLWPGTDGVFIEAGGQFLLSQPDAQKVEESSVHPYRREGMLSSGNSTPPWRHLYNLHRDGPESRGRCQEGVHVFATPHHSSVTTEALGTRVSSPGN